MELDKNNSITRSANGESADVEVMPKELRAAYIRQIRGIIANTGEVVKSVSDHRTDLIEKQDFGAEFVDYQRTQSWVISTVINGQSCQLTYSELSWAEPEEVDENTVDLSDPALFYGVEPEVWVLEIRHNDDEEPFYSVSAAIDSNCLDVNLLSSTELGESAEDFDRIISDLTSLNFGLIQDHREQLEF